MSDPIAPQPGSNLNQSAATVRPAFKRRIEDALAHAKASSDEDAVAKLCGAIPLLMRDEDGEELPEPVWIGDLGQYGIELPEQETAAAAATPTITAALKPSVKPSQAGFFERNTEQRQEIIEGLIREGQLAAFAGPYGVGKSPTLADIVVHVLNGIPWCGRRVEKRPVIHFDLETPGPTYKANVRNIAARLGAELPRLPEELDVYLEHGGADEPGTRKLLAALGQPTVKARLDILEAALAAKPDALVIIDPLELLFRIDTGKKQHVLALYEKLRLLLARYPRAAFLITFNLRKHDKKTGKADLMSGDPRNWLEEVCGTLDILNRSDVRLGMDFHDDEVRVINGVRRGEDMHPLLIRPVSGGEGNLAGFEACPPGGLDLKRALTFKQWEYWDKLRAKFRFEEVADVIVPRASLKRLLDRAKSLGVIEQTNGAWQKKGDR